MMKRRWFLVMVLLLLMEHVESEAQNIQLKINVPVLSYHQVRDWTTKDSKTSQSYIIPVKTFAEHMKMLHDSGYHTILPDQLVAHVTHRTPLPAKPVMLTFDDGTYSQYTNALPLLEKYDYKAVFFIMTVTLDRPGYMGKKQIQEIVSSGHIIGCHTWDHHKVNGYTDADWATQLEKPTKLLAQVTGAAVKYFAYPFGIWEPAAIDQLKRHGYSAAFQLSGKTDATSPLYTIRRLIADGRWDAATLHTMMLKSFK